MGAKQSDEGKIDVNSLITSILADHAFQAYISRADCPNFLEILGVARSETVHSAFLAWLFGEIDSQKVRTKMIRGLLQSLLQTRRVSQDDTKLSVLDLPIPDFLKNCIAIDLLKIERVTAETEVLVSDSQRGGRLDVLLTVDFLPAHSEGSCPSPMKLNVIIENKVHSIEHDGQTQLYEEWASKNFENYVCVFLIPDQIKSDNFATLANSHRFFTLTYQEVYDYCLVPSLEILHQEGRSREAILLSEYINSLKVIFSQVERGNKKRGGVMARTREDVEICKRFLERYETALRQIIETADPENSLLPQLDQATSRRRRISGNFADLIKEGLIPTQGELFFQYSNKLHCDGITYRMQNGNVVLTWQGQDFDSLNQLGGEIMSRSFNRPEATMNAWEKFRLGTADGPTLAEFRGRLQLDGKAA